MLYNGLYEQIINKGLDTELSGTDKCSQTAPIDSAEAPKALAKYVAEIVEKGLNNVKDNVLALGEKAEIIRSEASIAQSSESPRGGATGAYVEDGYLYIFQFPPPRGGRPCFCPARRHGVSISIPAPARGATRDRQEASPAHTQFQFPPPRGGRPKAAVLVNLVGVISIPAPARGATDAHLRHVQKSFISIPAPARGATRSRRRLPRAQVYFNSRPRAGGDLQHRLDTAYSH